MRTPATPGLVVGPRGVRLPSAPVPRGCRLALDGDPVVPVDRFAVGGELPWPGGLAGRVGDLGPTTVALVDTAGTSLAQVEHDFGGADRWQRPADGWGRRLTLDKWGWWTVTLGDREPGERDRAIVDLHRVLAELGAAGRPAWIAGGTLLGAVRDGSFLRHDDDVDIAYLASSSHPHEVARESFALERRFQARGWSSRRFSGAHFQLRGADVAGRSPVHVDVFSAFFTSGLLNQPFHIRGPMRPEDLLPLGTAELAGAPMPTPRDVEAWLALNYGAGWRTPEPDHVLGTPRHVQRLFAGWFGEYQRHLEYWQEERQRARPADPAAASGSARWLADALPAGTAVIELGCGGGQDAQLLAGAGFPVLATDFLAPILPLEVPESGVAMARANVSDPRDLVRLAVAARRCGRPVHLHARNLADQVDPGTRRALLGALRHFPAGTSMSLTVRVAPRDHQDRHDPTAGRLSWRTIRRDAAASGIAWEPRYAEPGPASGGTLLWGGRTTMGPAVRRVRIRDLPLTLRDLRAEIGELRRLPLRVAELEDLVAAELEQLRSDDRADPRSREGRPGDPT